MNRLPYANICIFSLCLTLLGAGCSKQEATDGSGNTDAKADSKSVLSSEDSPAKLSYEEIEWTDLIPKDDLEALENPPDDLAEIEDGSERDQLSSQLKAEAPSAVPANENDATGRYQQALTSQKVRPEYNGRHVRIPGFIVPLEFDDQQTITTFFLVPFFGACLHMPPPPPNQIIYAEYEPGIQLNALYDPFWIDGTLTTSLVENELATAAYSITVSAIKPYGVPPAQEWNLDDESDADM